MLFPPLRIVSIWEFTLANRREELIHIASVMHTSRHPDYWKSRLKNG